MSSKIILENGVLTLTQVFTINDIIEHGNTINAKLDKKDALMVLESLVQSVDPNQGLNEETIMYAIQCVLEDQVLL
jgi:hypothetical protein